VFESVSELLRPGGLWLFSSVGPDTLMELRQSWRAVDSSTRVHEFEDMHHLGDALLDMGFVDPVLDVDRINLTYPDATLLLRDLRTLGVVNAMRSRERGLMARRKYEAFKSEYEKFRQPDGNLPSTWEIIYGHAWVRAPGSVRVQFGVEGR
jgi:malonyl-CoA O-methyltransferase